MEESVEAFTLAIVRDFLKVRGLSQTLMEFDKETTIPELSNQWYRCCQMLGLTSNDRVQRKSLLEAMTLHMWRKTRVKEKQTNPITPKRNKDPSFDVLDELVESIQPNMDLWEESELLSPKSPNSHSVLRPPSTTPLKIKHVRSTSSIPPATSQQIEGWRNVANKSFRPDTSATSMSLRSSMTTNSRHRRSLANLMSPDTMGSRTVQLPVAKDGVMCFKQTNIPLSQESWIPMDKRMKMLRRQVTLTEDSIKQNENNERAKIKRTKTAKAVEKSRAPDRFNPKRRTCSLCGYTFKLRNLPTSISYKAIIDLHKSWGVNVPHSEVLSRPPLCYDEVRVCVFCSQFFVDMDYRGSKGSPTANKSKTKTKSPNSSISIMNR